ncbi:MAG: ChbG/HpnK family deacetylase [Chloroflexi bacterium]|nr:ChbG/HpnK family deacetylase [Chloroflexota bacterium]MBU1750332.1 ChbG/HpnK family deacetylase [Chloroflexota bacterium]MBU1877967.1 ChbG/HpnK family deacetylase [Chloroflexota bacterium]
MTVQPVQLIVNADDWGRSPGVNAGIEAAHRDGIVTSTTALMNVPGAGEALRGLHARCPALGLGVHLNLTLGRPLLGERVPSLTRPDGSFYPLGRAAGRMHLPEVRAELRAQVEVFLEAAVPLDHLDCHQHALVLHPALLQAWLDLAVEYRVPIRQPVPDSARGWRGRWSWRGIWREARERTQRAGVPVPARFIDTFYGRRATWPHLLAVIDRLAPGVSELLCHPGHIDQALRAGGEYVEPRAEELRILTDPTVRQRLASHRVELVTFAVLNLS